MSEANVKPAFIFKTAGKTPGQYDKDGGLLLVEIHSPIRIGPEDCYYRFQRYQEDQFDFVSALPPTIHDQLVVRFSSVSARLNWQEALRWKDRSPSTRLEWGQEKIGRMIARSRLVVHSYDSTGILETLSLNIPTLCFWQNDLDHLKDDAKPFYRMLQEAEILANSAGSAADFIAKHWDTIELWWHSEKVQGARRLFCQHFARTEVAPAATLKGLLTAPLPSRTIKNRA